MSSWAGGGIKGRITKLRTKLIERDGTACHWCGRQMRHATISGRLPDDYITIDHIVGRADGGSDDPSNLVLACYRCNQRRSKPSSASPPITERQLIELMSS
jgi:5-methylcytosine-specific restriction endonuclease McrA